jgi:hypothetical protein
MSTNGKKTNGRKQKTPEPESSQPEHTDQPEQQEPPVVTNWSREVVNDDFDDVEVEARESKPSVLNFDRAEVVKLNESLKAAGFDLSNDDLLKLLIVNGDTQHNPVIAGGCENILRQSHREKINRPFGGGRGRGGFHRGGNRFNNRGWENDESVTVEEKPQKTREFRETREPREDGGKREFTREPRENGGKREFRETREPRENGGHREFRETREPREEGAHREFRETRDPRENGGKREFTRESREDGGKREFRNQKYNNRK